MTHAVGLTKQESCILEQRLVAGRLGRDEMSVAPSRRVIVLKPLGRGLEPGYEHLHGLDRHLRCLGRALIHGSSVARDVRDLTGFPYSEGAASRRGSTDVHTENKRLPGQSNADYEGHPDPNADFLGIQSHSGGGDWLSSLGRLVRALILRKGR